MSPATLNSLSQAAEALPFVHTARRYYRLDGLVRSPPELVGRGSRAHYDKVEVEVEFPPSVAKVSSAGLQVQMSKGARGMDGEEDSGILGEQSTEAGDGAEGRQAVGGEGEGGGLELLTHSGVGALRRPRDSRLEAGERRRKRGGRPEADGLLR
ncbi:unnamed protein product [Pleuronectes platessa]|uniref:Uncharacterized protein n=1 Tax=Pleuronectes platessa TaxID=8262 RepID=A0A9N7UR78_PLEPL|nr:unnamed protein product [Pleuronectes platessa]